MPWGGPALLRDEAVVRAFTRGWPLLAASEVVGDLLAVPALLRRCAPWLAEQDVLVLQRAQDAPWTTADLPLLDRAAQLLGDPLRAAADRRRAAGLVSEQAHMATVVEELLSTADADSELTMLSSSDGLVDEAALPSAGVGGALDGPFAHVIVDEAQELTDAEWQMLLSRCPSRSFTIVGDRAQARAGFAESWEQRLARVGLDRVQVRGLSVNYRTPTEIMTVAAPVIRQVVPDANVPSSIRRSGHPVRTMQAADVEGQARRVSREWLAEHEHGTVCVIAMPRRLQVLGGRSERLSVLAPEQVKGLEFDVVILVAPLEFGQGVSGAVDRYVAMTRATSELVVINAGPDL